MRDWCKLNKKILLLAAGVFCVTFAFALWHRITPVVDAKAYDQIAQNIAAGNGFREQSLDVPILFDRGIQRAGPAYEYFLAALYMLFGHHYWVVWFVQALLHTGTAVLLYIICKKIFTTSNETIGLVAAALLGFHPDLIENAAMLLTETCFLFVTTAALYFFASFFKMKRYYPVVGLAVSLAIGFLIRPTIACTGLIMAVYFVRERAWTYLTVLAIVGIALITPWTVRNFKIYHQFIPTTLIGEYNVWVGNTVNADGGQLSGGVNPWDEYVLANGFGSVHGVASHEFAQFVTEHPGNFIRLTAVRAVRYVSLIRPMGFWFYDSGMSHIVFIVLSVIAIALLFVSGTAGAAMLLEEEYPLVRYFIAMIVTAPLPLLITVVQSRYRFPIYPFCALTGAYAIVSWRRQKRWFTNRAVVGTVIFFGVATLIDIGMSFSTVLSRIHSL